MSGIVGLLSLDRSGGLPEIASNIARGLAFRARGLMGGPAFVSPAACLWQIGFNPGLKPEDEPALVLDGVIYNRLELSSFLKIDPPTNDAGLALALYEAGGVDFLSRINGDFGLAVFDPRKHELILMRDRFGIKPLYYARVGGDVVFSSGIKAMFSHPGLGPEPDSAALFDFLATHYRYIHRDPARTFYRGVKAVPLGPLRGLQPVRRDPAPVLEPVPGSGRNRPGLSRGRSGAAGPGSGQRENTFGS